MLEPDIVVVCGDQRFPAHKVTLEACSGWFQDKFEKSLFYDRVPVEEIELDDDPDIVEQFLKYVYLHNNADTEDCHLQFSNPQQFFAMAKVYGLAKKYQAGVVGEYMLDKAKQVFPSMSREEFIEAMRIVRSVTAKVGDDMRKAFIGYLLVRRPKWMRTEAWSRAKSRRNEGKKKKNEGAWAAQADKHQKNANQQQKQ